jgi:hypothetical protein
MNDGPQAENRPVLGKSGPDVPGGGPASSPERLNAGRKGLESGSDQPLEAVREVFDHRPLPNDNTNLDVPLLRSLGEVGRRDQRGAPVHDYALGAQVARSSHRAAKWQRPRFGPGSSRKVKVLERASAQRFGRRPDG